MAATYNPTTYTQNVALIDPATLEPYRAGGSAQTDANPGVTRQAQGTPTQTNVALAANTATTILAAGVATVSPVRVLNYGPAPVYLTYGNLGATLASGSPSDFIPAAANGAPGQWESLYIPTGGLRAVTAQAGNVAVQTAG